MNITKNVTLDTKEVQRTLERLSRTNPSVVERALYEEAQIEASESKRRTPVDTNALRGSTITQKPRWSGREVSVKIEVGGPGIDYAIYVHENIHAEHKVGQHHFLSSTIAESKPHLARRVAKRIKDDIE